MVQKKELLHKRYMRCRSPLDTERRSIFQGANVWPAGATECTFCFICEKGSQAVKTNLFFGGKFY